jgi:hypothetical protein
MEKKIVDQQWPIKRFYPHIDHDPTAHRRYDFITYGTSITCPNGIILASGGRINVWYYYSSKAKCHLLRTFGKGVEFARFIWPGGEKINLVVEANKLVDNHELLKQAIEEAQVEQKEKKQYTPVDILGKGYWLKSDAFPWEKPVYFEIHTLVRLNQELVDKTYEVPGVRHVWESWNNWQYCLHFEVGKLFDFEEVYPQVLRAFKKWMQKQPDLAERLKEQAPPELERRQIVKAIVIERELVYRLIQNVYVHTKGSPYECHHFELITTFRVSPKLAQAIEKVPGVAAVLGSSRCEGYRLALRFGELFDPAPIAKMVVEFIDEWLKSHPVAKSEARPLERKPHHEECEQITGDKYQVCHEEGNELYGNQGFIIFLKVPHTPELVESLESIPGMVETYHDNRYKVRLYAGVLFDYLPIMYMIQVMLEDWLKEGT